MFFILVGVGGLFVTTHSPHVRLKQRKACFRQLSCRTSGSHLTHPSQNKKHPPFGGCFLFWWEWVDSNHLRLKPTDLQSAPALQLRRTPNLVFRPPAPKASVGNGFSSLASLRWKSLVRAAGNRAYKNTTSCVISNELMFASQGYPTYRHPIPFLVRAAGIEPAFQAWKACILAFVLCPQQIQSPVIIY